MNDPDAVIRQQLETIDTLTGLVTDVMLFLEFRKLVNNEDGPMIVELMAEEIEPRRKRLHEYITITMDQLVKDGRIGGRRRP
jgi:hypothetical protein